MTEPRWHSAGPADSFDEGVHRVTVGEREVVVARLDGELFAFNRLCPHVAGDMDRCEISGTIVTCPFHGWRFDLAAGGKETHGYTALRTYAVRCEDGKLLVGF